jgi:biotin-dependent carboxylase-like uncharacterized protein
MRVIVVRPGLLDTIQDLGRPGHRQSGVPEGGAADRDALILANRLVGNEDGEAGIEFTLNGPALSFPEGGVISLTGARFEVARNGRMANWNETLVLAAGEQLTIGRALDGCRAYLAVAGGIRLEPVLGSRATFLPGRFGGLQGRSFRSGDELVVVGENRKLRTGRALVTRDTGPLRVIAGPQFGAFAESAQISLFSSHFVVGGETDRTGIRLIGPNLEPFGHPSLPSQGVLPGAIQVPQDGQPIILGWDGPVTGGYPVIAGVIAADLGRVAQLKPGDQISFVGLDPQEARYAWTARQSAFDGEIAWLA